MNRILVFALEVFFIVPICSAHAQKAGNQPKGGPKIENGAVNQSCAAGIAGSSYVRIHGRLGVYNGGYPNLRLWHIGTNHLFGIYGDPADLSCIRRGVCEGDEDTKLPSNLDSLMRLPNPLFEFMVYGDFEIRLLEPYRPGQMQAACIVEAHNLVRSKYD
jgi:hypothetical protein